MERTIFERIESHTVINGKLVHNGWFLTIGDFFYFESLCGKLRKLV